MMISQVDDKTTDESLITSCLLPSGPTSLQGLSLFRAMVKGLPNAMQAGGGDGSAPPLSVDLQPKSY